MIDPFYMRGVCDRCGDVIEEPKDWRDGARWRWNGENWEHKCPGDHYTMGHDGRLISHELAAAQKRIAELEAQIKAVTDGE